MKLITFGAAASIAALLAGCCTTGGGGSGSFIAKACDPSQATAGGLTPMAQVIDTIYDTVPGHLVLKPNYDKVTGACIDSTNGNINIYGNNAASVKFSISFDASLSGKVAWPASPSDAVQVGDAGGGPIGPSPTWPAGWSPSTQPSLSGGLLTFTVPYEAGVQRQYQFQYVVPGQPGNALHKVEPMIVNH